MTETHVSADTIRSIFSAAMTQMYRDEVPRYKEMTRIVGEIDGEALARDPALEARLRRSGAFDLVGVERHGAIRVGRPEELAGLRRLFAVMGMYPVGYYDLSPAGVPVHSTCFRPVAAESLRRCPFRIFTSLLRPELIEGEDLRREAQEILARRRIFTPRCLHLIELFEANGGLGEAQAIDFVHEALHTFRWRGEATVTAGVYEAYRKAHPLVADVVCFHGPHINHLTLPTLDIDAVQEALAERGLDPKSIVEGPPPRQFPILLRQTSFKAIAEPVRFSGRDEARGEHRARFGEIEQRGAALTAKGRALYDRLLAETLAANAPRDGATGDYRAELKSRFAAFPDDAATLRAQGLAFFRYTPGENRSARGDVETLLREGALIAEPITYEDFLPVSAAGIFQSNLGEGGRRDLSACANREAFEHALGTKVADEMAIYAHEEKTSLARALGVGERSPMAENAGR
ncbi:VOC family protein [Methylosinus sp. H3A]|uniref:2-oxoadipate dioxygenase/decarboxylase HglS n=1 Tax=Methylosinus sp. H3A TaxID=2785786 RepID=UPI0018C27AA4|nr:VOC family protein [Methylosinus sp. H3A]MBG0810113.1 VOC family protein [Methylosinus sp. H3A]